MRAYRTKRVGKYRLNPSIHAGCGGFKIFETTLRVDKTCWSEGVQTIANKGIDRV